MLLLMLLESVNVIVSAWMVGISFNTMSLIRVIVMVDRSMVMMDWLPSMVHVLGVVRVMVGKVGGA